MLGVLEVSRRDDHGVEPEPVLGLVERDVASERLNLVADGLLDAGLGVLEKALLPEVGHGDHVEAELLAVVEEARQQRAAEAVGVANARHAHPGVGACGV